MLGNQFKSDPMSFFDQILVINLDRRPDRWQQAQSQLRTLGVSDRAQRVSGVDLGSHPGCTASHRLCIERTIASGGRTLIVEDDFQIVPEWMVILSSGLAILPDNWDMFYLGFNLDPHCCSYMVPKFVGRHLLQLNGCLTTHMYALNGRNVDRMRWLRQKFDELQRIIEIDVLYLTITQEFGLKCYGLYPIIAKQSNGFSDISGFQVAYTLQENIDAVLSTNRVKRP